MKRCISNTVALLLIKTAFWGDVGLTADDRFYPLFDCRLIEFNSAEHISVIRDRQRRHLVSLCRVDNRLHGISTIQEAVLCMQVEVDKIRVVHPFPLLLSILYIEWYDGELKVSINNL